LAKSPKGLTSSSRNIHRVCAGPAAAAGACRCSRLLCAPVECYSLVVLHPGGVVLHLQYTRSQHCSVAAGCCARLQYAPACWCGVCASVLHLSTAVSIALLVWQLRPVLQSCRCSASTARCWRVANWLRASSGPTAVPDCVAAGLLAWVAALTCQTAPDSQSSPHQCWWRRCCGWQRQRTVCWLDW
jgi:hypothetical protein